MRYTTEGIKAALAALRVAGEGLPEALCWLPQLLPTMPRALPGGGIRREAMNRRELVQVWPMMPLSQQVVLTAVLIGDDPKSTEGRLIAAAYRDLCQEGSLRPEAAAPTYGYRP